MIDEEIRDALDVDPSPEFLARVRGRVANEPAPSAWRWSWTLAATGAVAAALVVAGVVSRPEPRPEVAQPFRPAEPAAQEMRRPAPVAQGSSPAIAKSKRPATSRPANAFARQPEILIDPREVHALQQLIAGVRDGRVDLSAAQKSATPTAMELEPVADIVIASITIDPLAPLSGAEGTRP